MADTDKIDPQKPITVGSLVEMLQGSGKKSNPAAFIQMIMVAVLALGGTGIGQQLFGVSKDALEKETAAIKAQNTELLKRIDTQTTDIGALKERIARLETKIELGGK